MSILVIAEIREGVLRPATYAAVAAGQSLAEQTGLGMDLLLLGKGAKSAAEASLGQGGSVYVSEAGAVAEYTAEGHAAAAAQLVQEKGYTFVLTPATTTGKDLMPRLAGLLDAGMVSDVIRFEKGEDGVVYTRPMYAGNADAKVVVDTAIQTCTVRETAFDAVAPAAGSATELAVELDPASLKAKFVSFNLTQSARPELTEAKVVVSAGRGTKDAEGVKLIEQLADTLGAALGASRAVVDEGLAPNDLQVGQTGKIVAPDLYIACGISGAIQHAAGIKDSKVIVAINKDEEAPIFEVADYGLVDDLFKAVPKLIEKIQAAKA
jgi:electron transfer flavoprotein alpha subunit